MTRVTRVVSDPAIPGPALEPARVKVTVKSGRVIDRSSDSIKGSPEDPMSAAEMQSKLRACLKFGVGADEAQADRLAHTIASLENAQDAGRAIVEAFPA